MNFEEKVLKMLENQERILEKHSAMLEKQEKTLEKHGQMLEKHEKMLEGHESILEKLEADIVKLKKDSHRICLELEQVIEPNIQIIAEGHMLLSETMAKKDDILMFKEAFGLQKTRIVGIVSYLRQESKI